MKKTSKQKYANTVVQTKVVCSDVASNIITLYSFYFEEFKFKVNV